ncbi:MAG TPA: 5-formyltetrahydrofolate cyclo-ligase [Actinomycetes bacterium]|nr:5-formyltetrahydrofolate cyclo-ligase [Actinomycetes bacterium]
MTLSDHSPTPSKADLRAKARNRRAQRSEADRVAFGHRLAEVEHPALVGADVVALFRGVADEPDTQPLINKLHGRGVRVLLPIVMPDWSLDWAEYVGDDALTSTAYGLLEPTGPRLGAAAIAESDVVLVPAMSIDADGRRLGQGAGCYDRALLFVPTTTPVLAIVYDDEKLDDPLPEETHDRRVDGVFI